MKTACGTVMPRGVRFLCFALLLGLCFASGCASAPYTGRSQFITMSESEEMQLGAAASKQVLQKSKTETGTARAARVTHVGRDIAAVADKPEFAWEFHTLPNDELNAFCLPGGRVFVYTAMLDLTANNDDELAILMGHEIAHAIARHGAERVSQTQVATMGQVLAGTAAAIATGSSAVGEVTVAGTGALMQLGILLPYSRTHETEADHIGMMLAAKAGYDPRAAITLWRKMAEKNKGKERVALLSTHPLTEQRIKDLERDLPKALELYRPAR